MKQPDGLATKGDSVEEWADLKFFRPLGLVLATRLEPTRVSPDLVTLASLLIGLGAGALFWPSSPWINGLGLVLFLISDVFDSADGQLARLRGTSTRFGRMLDGISDNLRFVNLYLILIARLLAEGHTWGAVALGVAAGLSHSLQSTAVDFIRQAFLALGSAKGGELDLPEDVVPATGWFRQVVRGIYRGYLSQQHRLFPATVPLVRHLRAAPVSDVFRAQWRALQRPVVGHCAWIAQNIRFLLLAVSAVPGWTAGYFWLTLLPLNGALAAILIAHERRAERLAPTPLVSGRGARVSAA